VSPPSAEEAQGQVEEEEEEPQKQQQQQQQEPVTPLRQKKKKNKRKKRKRSAITTTEEQDEEVQDCSAALKLSEEECPLVVLKSTDSLFKYRAQRCRLFSRFNEGILLDQEGWYSVTPEKIAEHVAERCSCGLLIDAFCGVGGNTIQFAFSCERVIAIDINAERLAMAKHNAQIYGVADRIEFILGDYLTLIPSLKADVVFLSPPWGGPEYINQLNFSLSSMTINGFELLRRTQWITKNIAYCLPRNTDEMELRQAAGADETFEVEENYINGALKMITVYYGDLVSEAEQCNNNGKDYV